VKRGEDAEEHARETHKAAAEAGAEYEATLRKLRDSHDDEFAKTKHTNETLVGSLRGERAGEEEKLRALVDSLSADIKAAEDAIKVGWCRLTLSNPVLKPPGT